MRTSIIFLTVLLIFLSLVPRSADILSGNYLFSFDQGRDYLAAKSIVVDKKLTLIGSEIGAGSAGFKGIFHGPFHYYFLAIPFILFRGDPYGGILLTFLYGITAIVLSFFLGKKVFGLHGGLITALLVAMSPPLISASRFVWNSHGAVVFILLAFYYTYAITKDLGKEKKHIFLAAFFSAFIYNFQLAIAIPMCLGLFIYVFLILHIRKIHTFLLLFMGFFFAFSPMIFFELRHNLIATRGLIEYLMDSHKTPYTMTFLLLVAKDHLGTFFYNVYDTFPRLPLVTAEAVMVLIFGFTIYFLRKEKNKERKKFIIYLLLLPICNFAALFFLKNAAYVYYLLNLNFVYIFLFAYIFFSSYKKNVVLKIVVIIIFICFTIQAVKTGIRVFAYDYQDYGGTQKIKGKIDLVDYIYKDANGKRFGLFVFSPPIYTYPYDYVIWWYGVKKFGYEPDKEKKGLFYLAIEKDGSKPWSYAGWLETVIKTGTVLENKELPSGFIIQKRMGEKNEIQ